MLFHRLYLQKMLLLCSFMIILNLTPSSAFLVCAVKSWACLLVDDFPPDIMAVSIITFDPDTTSVFHVDPLCGFKLMSSPNRCQVKNPVPKSVLVKSSSTDLTARSVPFKLISHVIEDVTDPSELDQVANLCELFNT